MPVQTSTPPEVLRAAAELVLRLAGVVVPEYRWPVLNAELRALGDGVDVEAGLRRLRTGDERARQVLLDALTIPETYLFRHPQQFQLLRRVAEERARAGRPTSVLSAGCSSGEEVWSAAATLVDVPCPLGRDHRVDGWELSSARLERARVGLYRPWSCRIGLQGHDHHFTHDGDLVRVGDELRRIVRFAQVNLVDPTWPTLEPVDVILLRNVAIYWSPEVVAGVSRRLVSLLAADGLLLLGPSDPVELPRTSWRQSFTDGVRCYQPLAAAEPAAARAVRSRPQPPAAASRRRAAPPARAPVPSARSARSEPPRPAGGEAAAPDLLTTVRRLADEGHYDEAERLLEGARDPSAEVRAWRGIIALARDRHTQAIEVFRQCVFLAPEQPEYRRWLIAAFEVAGRLAEADRERRNLAAVAS